MYVSALHATVFLVCVTEKAWFSHSSGRNALLRYKLFAICSEKSIACVRWLLTYNRHLRIHAAPENSISRFPHTVSAFSLQTFPNFIILIRSDSSRHFIISMLGPYARHFPNLFVIFRPLVLLLFRYSTGYLLHLFDVLIFRTIQ